MEKYNNWKRKFYAIWAGQALSTQSLVPSCKWQSIFATEKTGSAMVLSMASLVGFTYVRFRTCHWCTGSS